MNKTEMTESRIFYTFRLAGKPLRGLVILILLAGMVLPYQFSAQAVAAPVAQYPNDVVGSTTPTFRWTEVSGSTGYTLYIYTLENVKIFSSPVTFTCEEGVCRYSHTAALTQGAYKWAVKATNGSQFSPTSNWLTFSVAPPAAPTALSPSGTISNPNPIFAWTKVAGATGYRLYVYTSANAKVFSGAVAATCNATQCSYASSLGLALGDYKWAVKAYNAIGNSPTSNWLNFSVVLALPAAPSALSPSGTIATANPTFTWSKVAGATGYNLYIYTAASVKIFSGAVTPTCGTPNCEFASSLSLASGAYKFAVKSRNDAGFSPTSNWLNFTVSVPVIITKLDTGYSHTCALTDGGAVKCWGYNAAGQVGDGTNGDKHAPVNVSGLTSNVIAIATGHYHSCAVTGAGAVKCWGYNNEGQLGNNSNTNSNVPVDVNGLSSGMSAVTAGYVHTCALTSAGGVKCWGRNAEGQLGNGTNSASNVPVDVSGLSSGVTAISAGYWHTCARTNTGAVKCWGNNIYGLLGNASTINSNVPVDAIYLTSGIVEIGCGGEHNCVRTDLGAIRCWGNNYDGELGNGTNTSSQIPVDVSGLTSGVSALNVGVHHNCVVSGGVVKCWGNGVYGGLGNGANSDSNVPVNVSGITSAANVVSAAIYHSCAVMSSGGVKCWGWNSNGQLGNGSYTSSYNVPVDVTW